LIFLSAQKKNIGYAIAMSIAIITAGLTPANFLLLIGAVAGFGGILMQLNLDEPSKYS
jgi:hypothetical protein